MPNDPCPMCKLELKWEQTGRTRRLGWNPGPSELCEVHRPLAHQLEHIRSWNKAVFANPRHPK